MPTVEVRDGDDCSLRKGTGEGKGLGGKYGGHGAGGRILRGNVRANFLRGRAAFNWRVHVGSWIIIIVSRHCE